MDRPAPAVRNMVAMNLNGIKIVIFDVNGVLIDSNLTNAWAMGEAFTDDYDLQKHIAAFYLTLTGIDRGTKIRRIQEKIIGRPFDAGEYKLRWERAKSIGGMSMRSASLIPGCREVLDELGKQNITRVALSNTPVDELRKCLSVQKLDNRFEVIRGGGDWPKTESLSRLLKEFRYNPGKCLLIGDGKGDLAAARQMGVPFVAIDPDTGEFDGESEFDGPYTNLAHFGAEKLGIQSVH
jgi:phosphoglycolate phosphatase-like HAD superfamily hydrolase